MFKACVQVGFQSKLNYDRIVVAVYVSIDPVKPFEELAHEGRECLREGYP